MAKLAVACTDERLYPRAVASFYFIHKAIAQAIKQHEKHPGAATDGLAPLKCCFPSSLRLHWREY
jgi:hypothetical protein